MAESELVTYGTNVKLNADRSSMVSILYTYKQRVYNYTPEPMQAVPAQSPLTTLSPPNIPRIILVHILYH